MKKIIISILAILVIFVLFKFNQKEEYVSYLQKQSNLIRELYNDFTLDYYSKFPKNKQEFNIFFDWLDENNYESVNINKRYGFNVKYDSLSKRTIFYSYGKDKKDNNLINTIFNKYKNNNSQYLVKDINLFEFIFKAKKHDVIILTLADIKFPCKELTSHDTTEEERLNLFQLHKGMKSVFDDTSKRKMFFNLLYGFEKRYNDSVKDHKKLLILFFLYEKGKLKIICKDKLSFKEAENIENELKGYFESHQTEYFDQAFFALRLLM